MSHPTEPAVDVERLRQSILVFGNAMTAQASTWLAYDDLVDDARTALGLLPDEVVRAIRDASARLTTLADERLGAKNAAEHYRAFLDANPDVFAELLRREARRDPRWLAEFIAREQRRTGRPFHARD